eukprot:TRINITY_DN7230_c0_g1_i1.p1 TRINITY_DN7230_c0_g1~~TRINITY_DN7230_c0_g1_i1.p1  ORF type:complete len:242 (-),score=47.44 TRINITY_DN7230_c0_g1_i1:84-809(-)
MGVSKIPDVYDSIKYDLVHNYETLKMFGRIVLELFQSAKTLADFVVPFEYGIDEKDKVDIGLNIITPLLKKIKNDLLWWESPATPAENVFRDEMSFWQHKGLDPSKIDGEIKSAWRHVRTRLYFSSASHLTTLFNVLHLGLESTLVQNKELKDKLEKIGSLDYLSQIVIRLFENLNHKSDDPDRFRLEILVNPGCTVQPNKIEEYDNSDHSVPLSQYIDINKELTLQGIKEFFWNIISTQQ